MEGEEKRSFEASVRFLDADPEASCNYPPARRTIVTSVLVIKLSIHRTSTAIINPEFRKGALVEEKKGNFDERYHASYACKLKTVPLEKIESAIAKAIGELTQDRVECTITNFCAKSQAAEIVISLGIGSDKRYSK